MEAKVIRWGDDLVVKLSPESVRSLGISEGQSVEITPKRGKITAAEMFAEMRRLGPEHEPETIDWGPDRGSEVIDDDDPR